MSLRPSGRACYGRLTGGWGVNRTAILVACAALGVHNVGPARSLVALVPGSYLDPVDCAGVQAGYGMLIAGGKDVPIGLDGSLEILTFRCPGNSVITERFRSLCQDGPKRCPVRRRHLLC